MSYRTLTDAEKQEYFDCHFPHRLVLLRTYRERFANAPAVNGMDGDLYSCAKDASYLAIRLWTDFFGLRGFVDENGYQLKDNMERSRKDDVKVHSFRSDYQLSPETIPHREFIARAYLIADKELAHITSSFQDRKFEVELLTWATDSVEDLIRTQLYEPFHRNLPRHGEGQSW